MTTTTLTARQFNQDTGGAKKAAEQGPVIITDRGRPSHVLLTYKEYERLSRPKMSLAEAVAGEGDFDFEPPRLRGSIVRPVDFD
jgi:prevent-host-death family protein